MINHIINHIVNHIFNHCIHPYVHTHIYVFVCIWINYTDFTATSVESWLREIIPKWLYPDVCQSIWNPYQIHIKSSQKLCLCLMECMCLSTPNSFMILFTSTSQNPYQNSSYPPWDPHFIFPQEKRPEIDCRTNFLDQLRSLEEGSLGRPAIRARKNHNLGWGGDTLKLTPDWNWILEFGWLPSGYLHSHDIDVPFIDGLPIIYKWWFSTAMLNNQMVFQFHARFPVFFGLPAVNFFRVLMGGARRSFKWYLYVPWPWRQRRVQMGYPQTKTSEVTRYIPLLK